MLLDSDASKSALPDGWATIRLGDACMESQRKGESDLPVLSVTKHQGIVLSSDYFGRRVHSVDTSKYKVVRRGEFAYATIHLNEGSVGLLRAHEGGLVSPMYTVFSLKDERIDPEYLLAVLKRPASLSLFQALVQGTVNRRGAIPFSRFSQLVLAHPPLAQQRKIAAILASIDETIVETEAVVSQAEVVNTALVGELLRGAGASATGTYDTPLGPLPVGWEVSTVGELARFSGGNGFRPSDWAKEGLPIIRIQNLNGSRDFNCYAGVPEPEWIVKPGELLFAWAGSRGASFGPCIWRGPEGVLNQHIYRIKAGDRVGTEFLYLLLKELTAEVEKRAHGFKDSLVHLRKAELTDWKVPVPPLKEQGRISEAYSLASGRLDLERKYLAQLNETRLAVIESLITGQARTNGGEVHS